MPGKMTPELRIAGEVAFADRGHQAQRPAQDRIAAVEEIAGR